MVLVGVGVGRRDEGSIVNTSLHSEIKQVLSEENCVTAAHLCPPLVGCCHNFMQEGHIHFLNA